MRLLYSRHLEHFLAVYDTRSLRKAADVCSVTQPALSKSLQTLEAALSVTLFERSATGMEPTAAAHIVRRHGQHIVNSSRYIGMEIAMLRGGEAGELRIGSGIVWSATRMPALLAALHARYPKLEITMHSGMADQLLPRLLDGQIDVMLGALPLEPLPPGYDVHELPAAEVRVFCRRGHPLTRLAPVSLRQVAEHDFVGFSDDFESQRQAGLRFADTGLTAARTILRSSSLETLLATVAASDSLTLLSDLLLERAEAAGLQQLQLDAPLWRIRLGICYRAQSIELAPLRTLVDMAMKPAD
ncbi:MAG TPA: LysR family transcriptional regulator [Ramlibacter sp.]|nr:LysR family transcriptional regulator [Ramlibacter sp.]